MPGTPSIWNGRMRPCQWIELSSSRLLVTASRTFWPSLRRTSGAGTVPFTPIAGVVIPSMTSFIRSIVRAISVPDTIGSGLAMPRDTGCAQAGR